MQGKSVIEMNLKVQTIPKQSNKINRQSRYHSRKLISSPCTQLRYYANKRASNKYSQSNENKSFAFRNYHNCSHSA